MTVFSLSLTKGLYRPVIDQQPVANDNPSREQQLFEKCLQRELGSLAPQNNEQKH